MYWRAETAPLWRDFWRHLQRALPSLPDLTPPEDIPDLHTHWLDGNLALSMTCGLPFRSFLKGKVTYVGTLDFDLGGSPGHYHSVAISNGLPSKRLAFNSGDSQSGWAVTQHAPPFKTPPIFTTYVETGGHAASLAAVANNQADIAYIDAVTWRLLRRYDPNAAKIQTLGRSVTTPGLPLIAAKGTDPEPLRAALAHATETFTPNDPMAMGGPLSFHVLKEAAYYAVPNPSPPPNS